VHKLSCDRVTTNDGASWFVTESEELKDASIIAAIFDRQRERLARPRVLSLPWFVIYAAVLFALFVLLLPSLSTDVEPREELPEAILHAKHFSRFFAPLASIDIAAGWPPMMVG